jgi:hypothetical protein
VEACATSLILFVVFVPCVFSWLMFLLAVFAVSALNVVVSPSDLLRELFVFRG